MKKIYTLLLLLFSVHAFAQAPYYAIRIEANTQVSPPAVNLKWAAPSGNGMVSIYKKAKSATNWGMAIAQLPATTTTYTDNNISADSAYEYYIVKPDTTQPYGFIYAGIREKPIHYRGAMILIVDSTFTDSLKTDIDTLVKDLRGDGWKVIRRDFARNDSLSKIKNYIIATYIAEPDLQAVYILGHNAVPYSGALNPDGHSNHVGAWPADVYYGDVDGIWNDMMVNNSSSLNPLNWNTPGDGKFDPNYIPSDVELQVGRVDLSNMPAFGKTEIQLMRSYLRKAHRYKAGALTIVKRALVDDNFKTMTEGFGGNGWRNFAPMVGIDSVSEKDLIPTLQTGFYQWAYGCGGGNFTSCTGVGATTDIAAGDMKTIFTGLFGSYFGDWNYTNDFMRAPLCANEPALASFWAGRPNWFMHHMALGEHIGYSTKLSQNNNSLYYVPLVWLARTISTALIGDPSLRTDYMMPVPALTLDNTDTNAGAKISWTASPEPGVAGYYVYRSTAEYGKYELRSGLVTGTAFTDSFSINGKYWYMVRATKLQTTASGTYYNLSIGIADSASFIFSTPPVIGVGNIATSLGGAALYPNPAEDEATLFINSQQQQSTMLTIADMQGRVCKQQTLHLKAGDNRELLNISNLPAGIYLVNIKDNDGRVTLKLVKR